MKFGGTSVADADAITRVVGIVRAARESSGLPPVVIVSAMSGVTDRLLELTRSAEQRRDAHVLNGVAELSRRHFEAIERLLPADVANDLLVEIGAQLDVIEYFAVEDDPKCFALVGNRLAAAAQIDNAQPRVAETNLPIEQNAKFIGSAMPQHAQHLAHIALGDCLPA